jgi:hypothetical protein
MENRLFPDTVDTGRIGFEIDNRCPVKSIKSPHNQPVFFPANKIGHGKTNRVGAVGGACGKHAVLNTGTGRNCSECCAIGTIQPVQDNYVGMIFKIPQTLGVLVKNFYHGLDRKSVV